MDKQVHESDLLIPALKIIFSNPGINTSQLKTELEKVVDLYPKDKEILKNRNDNYFSQTVRNWCGSHLITNEFGKCVNVKKIGKVNCFTINNKGLELINEDENYDFEEVIEDESYQKSIESSKVYDEASLHIASERKPQLSKVNGSNRYKTDPKIAKTVIANRSFKCEYGAIKGEEHNTFTNKRGEKYQEGHHLIPIKAQKDFKINIDRPENIICLCPICHRAIHNACKEEKLEILSKIYSEKINGLKKVGIYISIEDLYNKYYI